MQSEQPAPLSSFHDVSRAGGKSPNGAGGNARARLDNKSGLPIRNKRGRPHICRANSRPALATRLPCSTGALSPARALL